MGLLWRQYQSSKASPWPPWRQPQKPCQANIIEGVVTSANGAEAGVWVIAETHDFDTRFARIVVTNDEGRYLIPDLPEATYDIWVRGYGLIDSEKDCSDTRLQS